MPCRSCAFAGVGVGGENGGMQDDLDSTQVLVLADHTDEDGSVWRAITVDQGSFILSGHDSGPGVERILGCRDYEFERALTPAETVRLGELLGVVGPADRDLLQGVADRFASIDEFEAFLESHEISGAFWSQLGE